MIIYVVPWLTTELVVFAVLAEIFSISLANPSRCTIGPPQSGHRRVTIKCSSQEGRVVQLNNFNAFALQVLRGMLRAFPVPVMRILQSATVQELQQISPTRGGLPLRLSPRGPKQSSPGSTVGTGHTSVPYIGKESEISVNVRPREQGVWPQEKTAGPEKAHAKGHMVEYPKMETPHIKTSCGTQKKIFQSHGCGFRN